MKNNKKMIGKFRYNLNIHKNNEDEKLNPKQLISLLNSKINYKGINKNEKLDLIKDYLTIEDHKNKEKNLIDKFIKEKVNINRKFLNGNLKQNSFDFIINSRNEKNEKKNSSNTKYKDEGTFITKINSIGRRALSKEEKNYNNFGKSLNDNFINNIKEEMIKQGILIEKPYSSKTRFKQEKPPNHNYNNFEFHFKIFEPRIIKEFNKYINYYRLNKKKTLKDISKQLANKKEIMTKTIPIYIKAFKTNRRDVFHSRKVYDNQYQIRYSKPSVNLEEIIQFHNQNEYKLKKEKMPFYHFLRTVNNPYEKLKVSQNHLNSGNIFIKFGHKDIKI